MHADVDKASGSASEVSWSRYWSAGHEHSCPTSFDGFYGPQLQAFWARQCTGLTPNDLVLDLGCGNGGLLRFLHARFPEGASPQFRGVDAARLRTGSFGAGAPFITVHERTSFRALPLAPASVSLAISQFGLEYDNSDECWAEVLRVLRPAARVAFVMHKRGSRLDRVAADEVVIGRAALDAGLFDQASALLPYLQRAATPAGRVALSQDPAAAEARAAFNASSSAVEGLSGLLRHADYATDILRDVSVVLQAVTEGRAASPASVLQLLRQGVEDHLQRITALRACALDERGIGRVRERLLTAGFALTDAATIAEAGNEMGWTLEGQR